MSNKKYVNCTFPHFLHGGDYNPEQWKDTREIWDDDMRLMREANCNEMTVGIFAWSTIEPEEGVFDFSVFDEMIGRIYENGGRVILATPSGARPRWMAEKYPEVLRVDGEGRREHFKARHNHCYTSPVYREKVRIINSKLAERYGRHPAVVAWHISNEYGGECFCPLCREAFREYLKEKFHNDINELNRAYWTTFWSHTYTDFGQIEAPSPITDTGIHGLNLDWKRFVTLQTVDFMKNEIAPIKAVCPDIPVTTNMMYEHYGLDYNRFSEIVDVASWDSYPEWHSGDQEKTAQRCAFWHDFYRSLKKRPFLLMESTPSKVNWKEFNKPKYPGMDVLSSMQAIAHGSDSVMYFQWRKSRGSSEKLHGAVVDHLGTDETREFRSVKRTGEILKKTDEIAGTETVAEAAIIYDWENMWALDDSQGYSKNKRYTETCYAYHKAFWKKGVNCDVVSPHSDLSRYKLVIAPMLYLTDEKTVSNLSCYVKSGGTLYASYTTGTVDENDLCYLKGIPGGELKNVFGIWNEESDILWPDERKSVSFGGKSYGAKDICEVVHPRGAEVLAVYGDGYYSGTPALTVNRYGKGKAYYQAFRDCGEFCIDVISRIISELGIKSNTPCGALRYGVTLHSRTDGENEYIFVENYSDAEADVPVFEAEDMLTGEIKTSVSLPAYGFAILKRKIQ
ncbi:MAG: beta-galactosidase [Clostridia bacterium]|nr:beta-galactosidase [Clostridia bacterium]